jgi:hypothetical protein
MVNDLFSEAVWLIKIKKSKSPQPNCAWTWASRPVPLLAAAAAGGASPGRRWPLLLIAGSTRPPLF